MSIKKIRKLFVIMFVLLFIQGCVSVDDETKQLESQCTSLCVKGTEAIHEVKATKYVIEGCANSCHGLGKVYGKEFLRKQIKTMEEDSIRYGWGP